ncbi:galactokinase [Parasphingorhabdus cellanae]|uniref:Galactokinase n=1 Tax=Parasphingorhabdus cellanae TaxID=2806553 RepID=A0ABX7T344_9SPHN|nr:galactokinase [Parasphingorhabdus cellanae]QTD54944.1 galactokinase [Parasphingorhabdus cellanae]
MTTERRALLRDRVTQAYVDSYGEEPAMLVAAPGRVNLIGEHTDYNDGFVLPCAIDYETVVAIGPNMGSNVRALACDLGGDHDSFEAARPFAKQTAEWKNHVRGIAASLTDRGLALAGSNIAIAGNVPQGAGLSSSASLGVALAKAFEEMHQLRGLDKTGLALIAQHSENHYVGCACGIMDQLVSACAKTGSALQIDCRSLEASAIPIPEHLSIAVVHSGVQRGLVDSAYNERRIQCEQAAAHYSVLALRDLTTAQLEEGRSDLDKVSFRRARHVVSENNRTLAAAEALKADDLVTLSALMAESHASMRDDFEITVPAIDRLVEVGAEFLGTTGGIRMTGGGFGGCVVAIVPKSKAAAFEGWINEHYQTPDNGTAPFFLCKPSAGVSVLQSK